MTPTYPRNTIESYELLLKSTALEVAELMASPPMETVAIQSKAGDFVLVRQRVDASDRYVVTTR